jgi:hypothetical protein
MKLSDHLDKETKSKLNKAAKHKKTKKKKQEPNYKELMGQYRDTYKRGRGGAIRSK